MLYVITLRYSSHAFFEISRQNLQEIHIHYRITRIWKKSAISTIPLLFLFRHKLYFGLKFENVLAFAALQSD